MSALMLWHHDKPAIIRDTKVGQGWQQSGAWLLQGQTWTHDHCVTMRQCCQVTWCRGSGDEATSIMELYVRAVMSSDDFDKDVFDMEHFKVPCSILQSAFMPIACFACTCTRHPPAHTLHAHPRLTGTNNSSGCASQSNPIDS